MTEQELIERAIESAKARIYRVKNNAKYGNASHQRVAENQAELQKVTIKALEKQIAKKPAFFNGKIFNTRHCPKCRIVLVDEINYCYVCGQKLDWGNEDAE